MGPLLRLFLTLRGLQFCLAAPVLQYPTVQLSHPGDNVTVQCEHNDGSYIRKYWYRQENNGPLTLLGSTYTTQEATVEKDFAGGRIIIQHKTAQGAVLIILRVSPQDSALYYCASSIVGGPAPPVFGTGTFVSILEKGQEEKNVANVAIFRPNPKEQTDHGYLSIVCLASGFFPEHVQLQWKVNKKERDGSQGKAIKTGDTYSISSRLSLTKNEYYNPDNTFECSAGLRGRTDVKTESIRGEKSCGVSPDELKRIVNNGVYSYILILCKTALYGLIVTAIVLRKKAIANAY